MGIPVYLAMTAAEFRSCNPLPSHFAWLSCLFSPYGRGLSNIPKQLPPGSLLILSDRTPFRNHDPELIYHTLEETMSRLSCSGLLLDFEHPPEPQIMEIIPLLTALPCPVAVPPAYGDRLTCPVFVPYPTPSTPLETYINPWKGREIWLEVSTHPQVITVTTTGVTFQDEPSFPPLPHYDQNLNCHYNIAVQSNEITFTLRRTSDDLAELLEAATSLGITRGIGLYQELK